VTKPASCSASSAVRLARMEAVFIALMAVVVLLSGFVAALVLYKLLKADNS
jgi:cell division protein FtsL